MSPLTALAGAGVCLVGVCTRIWPRRFWYVTHGWWYQNPEDVRLSDGYLLWKAFNAVSVIMVGLTIIFASAVHR